MIKSPRDKGQQAGTALIRQVKEGVEKQHFGLGSETWGASGTQEIRTTGRNVEGQSKVAEPLPFPHPSTALPWAFNNSSTRDGEINTYPHKLKPRQGVDQVQAGL